MYPKSDVTTEEKKKIQGKQNGWRARRREIS